MTHAAEKTQPSCCFMNLTGGELPRNFGDVTTSVVETTWWPSTWQVATQKVRTQVGFFGGGFFNRKINLGSDVITTYYRSIHGTRLVHLN